ncbi:unnamed protein product [Amoebophrya sp. A25]|nr:unnamed protein product [Amoebophrya sp. A25]|eukprot:GSA25T00027026001.1
MRNATKDVSWRDHMHPPVSLRVLLGGSSRSGSFLPTTLLDRHTHSPTHSLQYSMTHSLTHLNTRDLLTNLLTLTYQMADFVELDTHALTHLLSTIGIFNICDDVVTSNSE